MVHDEINTVTAEAKLNVVAALQGAGDASGALADVVTGMVARSLTDRPPGSDEPLGKAFGTVMGALHGATEVGSEVRGASRTIMVGALRGARRAGKSGFELIGGSAAMLVLAAYEVGGDVSRAASGAVEGAIDSANDLSLTLEDAALAAGLGGLRAAGAIGNAALLQVRRALNSSISGVHLSIDDPFGPSHPHHA